MEYTLQQQVDGEFDDVVDRTIEALGDEGFGVLCDIDVRATFAEKLDEEFRQYRILGACNPALAFEGLGEEIELGALLPCNVVVYEEGDGSVVVSAVDPERLLDVAGNDDLEHIGAEVGDRFERVLDSL
ncbi:MULTISPECIES: DUF302 domain-containing protein [Halolamina]|uniref:Uncharacterized conserved protein, DUF302 family n=1 Tax=Halolamina pelagica TaxID=699431 RepID=A0A1I5TNQ4_9EURY|nr:MULTISPECIES: DUF302 domain-containing protein [Halolamina]NHX37727.1 DUF302 domain-containing protein [Halolamina sp. R1-12]SFP83956.1 Uncharacterized conserved protein, DUF302 family [Halolamina pelagica]